MSANLSCVTITIMKKCTRCGEVKSPLEYFVRDKQTGRLHAQCKLCYKDYRQTYYKAHYEKYKDAYLKRANLRRRRLNQEFRANMTEYMSSRSCADCGENDIRVLELDHITPENKLFTISQAIKLGRSWNDVLAEIKKCRVLCANCHKKRTARQHNWYKAL